jgi:hypothetical protein
MAGINKVCLVIFKVSGATNMKMIDFWDYQPGSSGSIVSNCGLDDRAIGDRSPAVVKGFFL